jgi:hypothetical protein
MAASHIVKLAAGVFTRAVWREVSEEYTALKEITRYSPWSGFQSIGQHCRREGLLIYPECWIRYSNRFVDLNVVAMKQCINP